MTDRFATRQLAAPGSASSGNWDDKEEAAEQAEQSFKRLTREEAAALRARNPMVSPWRVIAAQGAVGLAVAGLVWLVTGRIEGLASALYGAATAVIPGALMARGMTSRLSSLSPGVSAASVLGWGFVKLAVSVAMLVLAPRLVQPLSWPALLVALAACTAVYWVALSWRGKKSS